MRVQRDRIVKLCSTETSSTQQEDSMSLTSHLQELKRKHQNLSEEVEQAQRAPGVDDLAIASLKKQKLRLKEEIERLS